MKKLFSFTLGAMLIAFVSFSQKTPPSLFSPSAPATAMDTLNINEVSALILNGGDMHWNFSNAGYEVPKGSGIHNILGSALWIGGIDVGSQLRLAAQTYRQSGNDFWPGPLDTTNATIDSLTSLQYDKIWKISSYKIEEFKYQWTLGNVQNGNYTPDANILSWPAHGTGNFSRNLAPFVDVNGNGIYEPLTAGDYPKIKGDQMLWWVMNDKGNIHTATGGGALGVEIHASAYAYACPQIHDSLSVINYTTLYHYDIFNRSTFQLNNTYVGNWQDGDLGCYTDDYVGCNPAGNYGYIYNGDNDDNCVSGYGSKPPMLSTQVLAGPAGNLMSNFQYFDNTNGVPYGNPVGATHFYNYLSGKWGDGTPVTTGGNGYGGTTPTNFMYPDFPYNTSGWNEITAGNIPNDRRFVMSSGPFTFLPGAKTEFDLAIVWSRDTSLAFGSQAYFDKNLNDNLKIKQWFVQDNFPSCQSFYPCSASLTLVQDTATPANPLLWYATPTLTGTAPFSYLWDFGDGNTSTLPSPSHTYATAGHYNICLTITDANSCITTTCDSTYRVMTPGIIKYLAVLNTTGIEENTVSVNSIFPNPSNDNIEVSFSDFVKGKLTITDITGREVYSENINANNVKINVSTLPIGYYTLSIVSGSKTMREKIMIAR